MSITDKHNLLKKVERAIILAASFVVKEAEGENSLQTWRKDDNAAVTSIDMGCHDILMKELAGLLPLVSEEAPETHGIIGSKTDYLVIDPIDGTTACKRFLKTKGGQVGFGPLVGIVEAGKLQIASFYNVPQRTLYSAIRGEGAYSHRITSFTGSIPEFKKRNLLKVVSTPDLTECTMLFFASKFGEAKLAEHLKSNHIIDTLFRFGGFANDCSRIASGLEEIQLQFACKAWDFSAVLFEHEAGVSVTVNPIVNPVNFEDWIVSSENPVLCCPFDYKNSLISELKRAS